MRIQDWKKYCNIKCNFTLVLYLPAFCFLLLLKIHDIRCISVKFLWVLVCTVKMKFCFLDAGDYISWNHMSSVNYLEPNWWNWWTGLKAHELSNQIYTQKSSKTNLNEWWKCIIKTSNIPVQFCSIPCKDPIRKPDGICWLGTCTSSVSHCSGPPQYACTLLAKFKSWWSDVQKLSSGICKRDPPLPVLCKADLSIAPPVDGSVFMYGLTVWENLKALMW